MATEKTILTVDLYDNVLTEKPGDYAGKVRITGTIHNKEIAARIVAKRTEYRQETIENILGMADEEKRGAIVEGKSVVDGVWQYLLNIGGSFDGKKSDYKSQDNKLGVTFTPRCSLVESLGQHLRQCRCRRRRPDDRKHHRLHYRRKERPVDTRRSCDHYRKQCLGERRRFFSWYLFYSRSRRRASQSPFDRDKYKIPDHHLPPATGRRPILSEHDDTGRSELRPCEVSAYIPVSDPPDSRWSGRRRTSGRIVRKPVCYRR